jgi:hypothetical protein
MTKLLFLTNAYYLCGCENLVFVMVFLIARPVLPVLESMLLITTT